ncbi:hypothetical protein [Sphingobacterium sp. E70]|nr:hypothetical protein [Sphingobacterium sp. E70]
MLKDQNGDGNITGADNVVLSKKASIRKSSTDLPWVENGKDLI